MLANKINGLRALARFDNRWQLFADRLLFRRRGLQVYRIGNIQVLLDEAAGDQVAVRELFTTPTYSRFLPRLQLPPSINVLDVGSHIGSFSLMLASQGISVRKVACVEMNPATFLRMRFNVERNFPRGSVQVFNAAVGGSQGEISVQLGSGSSGDSIHGKPEPGTSAVQVPLMRFDDVFTSAFGEEIVDLCKIDIEGAEYDVLAGEGHQRLRRCRYIITELHERNGHQPSEALSAFSKLGFEKIEDDDRRWPMVFCLRNRDTSLHEARHDPSAST